MTNDQTVEDAVQEDFDREHRYAQEDFDREHRYAQAALRLKSVDVPPGKTRRYASVTDCSGGDTVCDVVWIDRLTGNEVIRYDGTDPANTNSYYGAIGDEQMFERHGLDPYALIDAAAAKPLPVFPHYWDDRYDDVDDFDYLDGDDKFIED